MIPIQQIVSGQAIGSAISVQDSATLAQVGIGGLTTGTQVWNQGVGAYFALTVSSAALVTDQVVAVANVDGWRWVIQSPSNVIPAGSIALTKLAAQAPSTVVGNAAVGSASPTALTQAQLTALVNPATASLPGAMTAAQAAQVQQGGLISPTFISAQIDFSTIGTYALTPSLPGFIGRPGSLTSWLIAQRTGTVTTTFVYSAGNDGSNANWYASQNGPTTTILNGGTVPTYAGTLAGAATPINYIDLTTPISLKITTAQIGATVLKGYVITSLIMFPSALVP